MKKKLVFGELVMAVLSGGKDAHARCRVPKSLREFTLQSQL